MNIIDKKINACNTSICNFHITNFWDGLPKIGDAVSPKLGIHGIFLPCNFAAIKIETGFSTHILFLTEH